MCAATKCYFVAFYHYHKLGPQEHAFLLMLGGGGGVHIRGSGLIPHPRWRQLAVARESRDRQSQDRVARDQKNLWD